MPYGSCCAGYRGGRGEAVVCTLDAGEGPWQRESVAAVAAAAALELT